MWTLVSTQCLYSHFRHYHIGFESKRGVWFNSVDRIASCKWKSRRIFIVPENRWLALNVCFQCQVRGNVYDWWWKYRQSGAWCQPFPGAEPPTADLLSWDAYVSYHPESYRGKMKHFLDWSSQEPFLLGNENLTKTWHMYKKKWGQYSLTWVVFGASTTLLHRSNQVRFLDTNFIDSISSEISAHNLNKIFTF